MSSEDEEKLLKAMDFIPNETAAQKTFAAFLELIGKRLKKEEDDPTSYAEIRTDTDALVPYRAIGSKTILRVAETFRKLSTHEPIDADHFREAVSVLGYVEDHSAKQLVGG